MTSAPYGMLNPLGLWSLLAMLAVMLLAAFGISKARRLAVQLGIGLPFYLTQRVTIGLFAALALAGAIVRPYWGAEDIPVHSRGDDLLFLVDISRSMYAADISPSRLEVTKRKIKDLVSELSSQGKIARFGITVFAGDGYTVCPVTTDRGVLKQFVDRLSPELVSSQGSNLKAGIHAALSRLDDAAKSHSRVVLLSDGEDNFLDAADLVREINGQGIRFDVLGIGTPEGATLTLPNGATLVDQNRRPVVSSLKEDPLKAIARAGGGVYARVTLDDSDIKTIIRASASKATSSRVIEEKIARSYREVGPWLVCLALVTLLLAVFSQSGSPLAIIALVLSWGPSLASAQPQSTPSASAKDSISTAFELYHQGSYEDAAAQFQRLLEFSPSTRELLQGLASSLYRLGKYNESAKLFGQLAQGAKQGRHFFEASFNQGNSLLKLRRYQEAIDAFQMALDVKPGDPQATHNLGVARALLEEEKRRALEATPTPSPTPTQTPTAESSPETQPSPQSSESPTAEPSESPLQEPTSKPEGDQTPSESNPTPEDTGAEPSAAPSHNDSNEPHATAAANTTSNPATPSASPQVEPTTLPSSTPPTPTERLKEAIDSEPEALPALTPAPQQTGTSESFSFPEVDAWLQSLPESPLLIRPHRGTPASNGQTW